jgi:hypothetical protein
MLADRSNNTLTSGLVVHDVAGLNVCDSRTSPPASDKALVHVERGLCPVPPGGKSGVSWQAPNPLGALWWRHVVPRTCGPTTNSLSDRPRAMDRESVDRRDRDPQELVLARGATVVDLHGIGPSAAARLLAAGGDIRPPSPGPVPARTCRRRRLTRRSPDEGTSGLALRLISPWLGGLLQLLEDLRVVSPAFQDQFPPCSRQLRAARPHRKDRRQVREMDDHVIARCASNTQRRITDQA